jgi:hypothetical protein
MPTPSHAREFKTPHPNPWIFGRLRVGWVFHREVFHRNATNAGPLKLGRDSTTTILTASHLVNQPLLPSLPLALLRPWLNLLVGVATGLLRGSGLLPKGFRTALRGTNRVQPFVAMWSICGCFRKRPAEQGWAPQSQGSRRKGRGTRLAGATALPLAELPLELFENIAKYLNPRSMAALCLTCKALCTLCRSAARPWSHLDVMLHDPHEHYFATRRLLLAWPKVRNFSVWSAGARTARCACG